MSRSFPYTIISVAEERARIQAEAAGFSGSDALHVYLPNGRQKPYEDHVGKDAVCLCNEDPPGCSTLRQNLSDEEQSR